MPLVYTSLLILIIIKAAIHFIIGSTILSISTTISAIINLLSILLISVVIIILVTLSTIIYSMESVLVPHISALSEIMMEAFLLFFIILNTYI